METEFKKIPNKLLFIFYAILSCYLLFFMTYDFSSSIRYTLKHGQERMGKDANYIGKQTLLENGQPLCDGKLLNRRNYADIKQTNKTSKNNPSNSRKGLCRLFQFNVDHVVTCLDDLYYQNQYLRGFTENETYGTFPIAELTFLFVGDSRVRQQFYNFLKVIPDYDRRTEPNPIPVYHGNIDVISDLLQLRVSFRWRTFVDKDVIQMFRKLENQNAATRPRVIFLSMAAWHMLETRDAFQIYGNKLRELSPILGHLAKASKVIWLNQYPTIDFYGETEAHNTKIFSEKIYRYNEGARGILRNQSNLLIWDSSNTFVEEYVRSCAILERMQFGPMNILDPSASFINCKDYVHPGYSALSQATRILYNDICSSSFDKLEI